PCSDYISVCRKRHAHTPHPLSFPTRRSSDLKADGLTLQQERKLLQKSAYIQEKLGAYDQAADCYEELLEKNPKDVDAFCQYALIDRKSTRLNSSHVSISYAVFCLKKKKKKST